MSTQNGEEKAAKYLAEGRVKVGALYEAKSGGSKFATLTVQGSDPAEPYTVTYFGRWSCNCPARKNLCAHVLAAHMITDLRDQTDGREIPAKSSPELEALLEG